MFSQKKPSLLKLIVACFEILSFNVLIIGVAHGAIGFTFNVRYTNPAEISAVVGV